MRKGLEKAYRLLCMFGIDPRKTVYSLMGMSHFFRDLKEIKNQNISSQGEFPFGSYYPCLQDRFSESGQARGHYFHQDLLVARRIFINKPDKHVDIGSRIDGFVGHVASFRLIEVFDIRPLPNTIVNVSFKQADLMAPMNTNLLGYCDSLSCLHALEHFGLGRYGDVVNYDGYKLGLDNLAYILKQGGKLYLSVPIGPQRIEFNAHRVFSMIYLLELFSEKYQIDQFSFVDDQGDLHENVLLSDIDVQDNFGCHYGCGIFEMTKTL